MQDAEFPFIVNGEQAPLGMWLGQNRVFAKGRLAAHGAVLFRDFEVNVGDLASFASAFCDTGLLPYEYGSTPRTRIAEFTYSSTEYPSRSIIAQHCECSYQNDWPTLLFFYCNVPAREGGCTPIASLKAVTSMLSADTISEFERKGVLYVRNYYPELQPTWQSAFGTKDKRTVESYCHKHSISFKWFGDDCLTTAQRCQGILTDPRTREKLWFNQAHLFHPSALDPAIRSALLEIYSIDQLPRTAFFGDGSELEPEVLSEVRTAFQSQARRFVWQERDVLVLDNIRISHGRDPYVGPREIYVAMADLWSEFSKASRQSVVMPAGEQCG